MPKERYEIEGRQWVPISRAAELLATNAQGVRKLMAQGTLDWRQTRANSRTLVVDEQAVMALRKELPDRALMRSPDPLASRPPRDVLRRVRSEVWDAQHLRVTLGARKVLTTEKD
jgi:hypothetical protein